MSTKRVRRRTNPNARRGNRVIEYIRVSDTTGREEKLLSPEMQHNENLNHARREGLIIVDTVTELDMSGRTSEHRQIANIIDRVEAGEADGVIVWKISRWGRNTMDSLLNIGELQTAGGFILSSTENLNELDTPAGKFQLTVLLAIAQMFSDEIGRTWVNIHDYRRTKGRTHGSGPRLGYQLVKDLTEEMLQTMVVPEGSDHVVDPATAPWVRQAYEWYVSGMGLGEVVRKFNEAGITSTRGNKMTYRSLMVSLDSGFAAGRVVDKRNEEDVFHPGAHEPIIDEDLWQKYRTRRKEPVARRVKNSPYRLAKLMRCGHCGGSMSRSVTTGGGKRKPNYFFRCAKHRGATHQITVCEEAPLVGEQKVEKLVYDWLKERSAGQAALDAEIARTEAVEAAKVSIEKIDKEISRLEKRVGVLTAALIDEKITQDAYTIAYEDMKKRIGDMREARAGNETTMQINDMPAREAFGAVLVGWDVLDPAQAGEGLRHVISRIEVFKNPVKYGRTTVRIVAASEVGQAAPSRRLQKTA